MIRGCALLLAVILMAGIVAGCGPRANTQSASPSAQQPSQPQAAPAEQSYQAPAPEVATQPPAQSEQADTVYVTKTGKCYHQAGCSSLSRSKITMSRSDAIRAGCTACSNCNP